MARPTGCRKGLQAKAICCRGVQTNGSERAGTDGGCGCRLRQYTADIWPDRGNLVRGRAGLLQALRAAMRLIQILLARACFRASSRLAMLGQWLLDRGRAPG